MSDLVLPTPQKQTLDELLVYVFYPRP
ncbi:uncharacterized protein METZ01_LOCUS220669 [marine metagenome]|uniref:Uncharacterized protein n=1 Tax=marine metagenome TaxID=408172 RepID=A0A382FZ31_9ZZZZ